MSTKKWQQRAYHVQALSLRATRGHLVVGLRRWPCALGRSGRRAVKREGDGASPIGCWAMLMVYYRGDRGTRPRTGLPLRPLRINDGWCDAPADRNYNRAVRLPYSASAEHLWRDDRVYDLIVVLGHNQRPRQRGAGSAIFMHLARPGFTPTAGCIALTRRDLRQVLALTHPGTRIKI